jgi:hypothetical protein
MIMVRRVFVGAVVTAAVTTGTGGAGAGAASASPDAPTCADVGGVFVAHGTDGRGSCMSADPRPKCHIPPGQQDAYDPGGNYVAELVLTPPFPGGTLQPWDITMLKEASNKDCWKLPGS